MPGLSVYGMKLGLTTPAAFAIIDRALCVLVRARFSDIKAMQAFNIVVDHAFMTVNKLEVYMAQMQKSGAQGGCKIMHLTQSDSLNTHLTNALGAVKQDFSLEHVDQNYREQLNWIISGIAAEKNNKKQS